METTVDYKFADKVICLKGCVGLGGIRAEVGEVFEVRGFTPLSEGTLLERVKYFHWGDYKVKEEREFSGVFPVQNFRKYTFMDQVRNFFGYGFK